MKVFWVIFLILGLSIVTVVSGFWPTLMADNKFLQAFVNHEIVSLLAVVMTITFASVANIHLTIDRTQASISNPDARKRLQDQVAQPLKNETRSSAWLLFWALVLCIVLLILKGSFPEQQNVVSFVHGMAILILMVNGVVMYDIYETAFELGGTS